ncbi:MAG: hypothetical protein L6R39_004246 [Caloplaca ligustica]|nr:MAG: hypothetical protein L6R39_004246 [Caloplaca ligustica]
MRLQVLPCSLEDLPTCSSIQWQAFAANPNWQILFPNGGTSDLQRMTAYHMRREYPNSDMFFVKVVDTSSPDLILGFAKWTIENHHLATHTDERNTMDGKTRNGQENFTESSPLRPQVAEGDSNDAPFKEWMPELIGIRHRHLKGNPTLVLDELAVRPEHQWQGAGTLLLRHLVDFADAVGMPCYLESTPVAYSMYIRQGFRKVDEFVIDLGKWKEGYGMYKTAVLYRAVRKAQGRQKGDKSL